MTVVVDERLAHAPTHPAAERSGKSDPPWLLTRPGAILCLLSAAAVVVIALSMTDRLQPDFLVYRMGGMHLFGANLYSVRLPHSTDQLQFTYTPFAAILFWPFGQLSIHAGQVFWALLNCGALFALTLVSIKVAKAARRLRSVLWTALAVLAPVMLLDPVRMTMYLGQVNILIVLMVVADLTCVLGVRAHTLPRGVLVGVAAAIKLTPLIFIPFLFLNRQFRAGFTALCSFLSCTVLSTLAAPKSSWLYWTKEWFDTRRVGSPWYNSNQSLQGALDRLTGSAVSPLVLDVATVLFAAAGLAVAVWAYRRSSPFLGILLCGATGLIVSPISWSHHYVWIVPALAWMIFAPDRPRGGRWWALGASLVFLWAPQFGLPIYLHHYAGPLQYLEGNDFFLATVAFLALAAARLWRRGRSGVVHGAEQMLVRADR